MERVAIWGPSFKYTSGISYYTQRLGKTLDNGYQVYVWYCLFNDLLPKILFPGRDRVSNVHKWPNRPWMDIDWWNPFSLWAAIKSCRNADTVIFEWWTGAVGLQYLIAVLMLRDKNLILEYHEFLDTIESRSLLGIYSRGVLWLLARLVQTGVFHSEAEVLGTPARYHCRRVRIIPHGVYDTYEPSPLRKPLPETDFTVLFFGLVRQYKGVNDLIEAFQAIDSPYWHLNIVGEEWDHIDIPDDDRITRVNEYVPDAEVPAWFDSAHVVVLPYSRASQSGVAHLAIRFGLPIIASNVGGMAETLNRYPGTLFVEPGKPEEIARALQWIYDNYPYWYPHTTPPWMEWDQIKGMWYLLFQA